MNVTVKVTGIDKVQRALTAVGQARRYVGEVYIEGERNRKLATIHEGGAILREGASTSIATQRRPRRGTQVDRPVPGPFRHAGHAGQIPARNWLFVQTGDVQRIRERISRGVLSVARGGPAAAFEAVMRWCVETAVASMRRNVTGSPRGGGAGAHVGLAEEPGARVGHGRKMLPLTPQYKRDKDREVGAKPVLWRTGEMIDSVKGRVVEGAVR